MTLVFVLGIVAASMALVGVTVVVSNLMYDRQFKKERERASRRTEASDPGTGTNTYSIASIAAGSGFASSNWLTPTANILSIPVPTKVWVEEEVAEITGWRVFVVDHVGDFIPMLESVTQGTCWEAATLKATCSHVAADHEAPAPECSCGVYLLKSPRDVAKYAVNEDGVIGRCVGWGKAVEHENGYRCEYVRVEALYVTERFPSVGNALSERYGLPVGSLEANLGWMLLS